MSLDSAQKTEIKTFVDELSKKKEQLTLHEQQVVVNAVKGYLDSDRDLAPKEETLIKNTAKRYNWFISVLACAMFGTIAALAWTTYKNIENNAKMEFNDIIIDTNTRFEQEIKKANKKVKEVTDYAEGKTKDYKEYTDKAIDGARSTIDKLFSELVKSHKDVQVESGQIKMTKKRTQKTMNELERTLDDVDKLLDIAEEVKAKLDKTTKNLNHKAELVEKYDGLFKTLEKGNDQLTFGSSKNKNQHYFQIGELLFVWGKEKINKNGTTVVEIEDRRFSSKDEMTVSVTGYDFKGQEKGYPYVKEITPNSFICRFVKGWLDKTDYLEEKEFYYMALGKAAIGN